MRHKSSFAFLRLGRSASAAAGSLAVSTALAISSLTALAGCAPKIGDGCKQGIDCDVRGQRICDRAQPGGYCTINNCKPGDCGDDGVCVRFRPDEPRLSSTFCMAKCGKTSDCDRDAYVCRGSEQLREVHQSELAEGEEFAEVLDGDGSAKFCTAKEP